ncbi:prepilin-type N-terminal cleavage/methylation domain-containing protein [Desulfococcaceae bacterium HSG9]|nr:prepilin-type N-terminal cleavage/methylation domain-containing protein [Desulfococcaceae bacterium HSG9]
MKPTKNFELHIVRNHTGFTLLEVMVALSIIAIALTSVYKLHGQTIDMFNDIKFYTSAPLLAQSKMAEIETMDADDLSDNSGDFGDDFPGFNWQVTVNEVESELLDTYAENLKRIDLTVSLNDEQFTYHFRKYHLMTDVGE